MLLVNLAHYVDNIRNWRKNYHRSTCCETGCLKLMYNLVIYLADIGYGAAK